jgi:putative RecB family exonuclease
MSTPEHLSVSQIALYRTCSLKYRFQYLDQLPRGSRPAGLVLGSAVHKALEWLHQRRQAGLPVPLDTLLRVFEADWHAQCLDADIRVPPYTSPMQLVAQGKQVLTAYARTPARPVQAVEWPFEVPLVDPATGDTLDVPLRGLIDLIEAPDVPVEFKTTQKRWPTTDLPDNLQLTAYSYAYERLVGRAPTELRLVTLVRTRIPAIETYRTTRGPRDYQSLFALAREVRRGIRAGFFLPNRGCWLCRDCEYDQPCREWTGNAARPEDT